MWIGTMNHSDEHNLKMDPQALNKYHAYDTTN